MPRSTYHDWSLTAIFNSMFTQFVLGFQMVGSNSTETHFVNVRYLLIDTIIYIENVAKIVYRCFPPITATAIQTCQTSTCNLLDRMVWNYENLTVIHTHTCMHIYDIYWWHTHAFDAFETSILIMIMMIMIIIIAIYYYYNFNSLIYIYIYSWSAMAHAYAYTLHTYNTNDI